MAFSGVRASARVVVFLTILGLTTALAPVASAQTAPPPDVGRSVPGRTPDGTPLSPLSASAQADEFANVQVEDLPPLDPPDGSVGVPSGPSLAAQPVEARPVGPGKLAPTIPAGGAFAGQLSAEALRRLTDLGLTANGQPDLDTGHIQPVPQQDSVLRTSRATPEQLRAAAQQMPGSAKADPVRLQRELPDGIPLITYRLCAESRTKQASCSIPLPLLVPQIVDVTGDGTPDVLADVLPTVDVLGLVDAVREILNLQREIDSIRGQITRLTEILKDPAQILLHPWATLEKLRLEWLIGGLVDTLADKLSGLRALLNVGLGMLVSRLPTSETHGQALPAHVWAGYDIPGSQRFSFGFDGFRRGESLSAFTWGQFTTDVLSPPRGVFDAKADLFHVRPAPSIATTFGRTTFADGRPVDSTVASARSAPVPTRFGVRAVLDSNTGGASVDVNGSEPSQADVIALTNNRSASPPNDRFTQAIVDRVPTSASADVTRDSETGRTDVEFTSSEPIQRAEMHDFLYHGAEAQKIISGSADELPTELRATVAPSGEEQALSYRANAPLARAVDVAYSDVESATVARARMADLPESLDLTHTIGENHLVMETSSPVGSIDAQVQRNGAAIAVPDGEHATLITDGQAQGFSGRLTGLRDFDITYGAQPHVVVNLEPGGQPFVAGADIDGTHLARVEVSNLPPTIDVLVNPAERTANYRASTTIDSVRAAYANTESGPTIDGRIEQVPSSVDLSFRLGDQPRFELAASGSTAAVQAYFSTEYVPVLDPRRGNDVYVSATGVPAALVLDLDVPGKHLNWDADAPVSSVHAFGRTRVADRDWVAAARVEGVPSRFDADFADGNFRFRGLSGPLDSATLAVTNHPGAVAPSGPHLAVHYQQGSEDLDASASLEGIRHVEYAPAESGFRTRFDAAAQTVALDADVLLAGDVRLAAEGYVGPLPGNIEVSSSNGVINYSADRSFDVTAQVWIGKVAALDGLGTPRYQDGITASAGVCQPGSAGCSSGGAPFCVDQGCLGVTGIIDLSGLPSKVTVNAEQGQFGFSGYQPRTDSLRLFVRSPAELSTVPVEALATLSGLTEALDFTVGPMNVSNGQIDAGYKSNVDTLARLQVDAETDVPDFGPTRGRLVIDRVPGTLQVGGKFGKETDVTLKSSSGIDHLGAQVSTVYEGEPASGMASLDAVPPELRLTAGGFGSGDGLNLPTMTYAAPGGENTLDGSVEAEAALVAKTGDVKVGTDDLALSFRDLGSDTKITVNPDTFVTDVVSTPSTGQIQAGANVHVSAFPRTEIDKELFEYAGGFFTGKLTGSFGMRDSRIGNIMLSLDDINQLHIRPGKMPSFLPAPAAAGMLVPGFDGDYGSVELKVSQVELNADADITFNIDRTVGPDVFRETLRLGPTDTILFHRYDQEYRPLSAKLEGRLGPVDLVCVELSSSPSMAGSGANGITIRGENGEQSVNFLDPGGVVADYILDLASTVTDPFGDYRLGVSDWSLGGC